MSIQISVPGSIMLLGEHAVLRGYRAAACAIDRFIHVELIPRKDSKIIIHSDVIGEIKFDLSKIPQRKAFRFVLKSISYFRKELKRGFSLNIRSEFSDKIGLGSSAAVTVATVAALHQFLYHNIDSSEVFRTSLMIVRKVQGIGSGADVAASVFGGVVAYQIYRDHIDIQKIKSKPPIELIYVGYKTPTVEVISEVNKAEKKEPKKYYQIFKAIGKLSEQGIDALKDKNWKCLGEIFNKHQKLQKKLGVSDENMDKLIKDLNKSSVVYGAKISGSGLGDCVVVLKRGRV